VRIAGTALTLLLLVAAPALDGQQRGRGQGERGDRAQMRHAVQQRFNQAMQERLGLNEDQMRELGQVMREFGEQRRELSQRQQRARMRVRMLGREEMGGAELTEESAREALDELLAIAEEEVRLFRDEQAAMLEMLTPIQMLQFQQLREQMAERLRSMRGGPPGGGGPGNGSPMGPRLLPGPGY